MIRGLSSPLFFLFRVKNMPYYGIERQLKITYFKGELL
nr:MAG TPA: hypothetical protein [Caudoviricetes sp.]